MRSSFCKLRATLKKRLLRKIQSFSNSKLRNSFCKLRAKLENHEISPFITDCKPTGTCRWWYRNIKRNRVHPSMCKLERVFVAKDRQSSTVYSFFTKEGVQRLLTELPGQRYKYFHTIKQSILRKATLNKQKRTSRPKSGSFNTAKLKRLRGTKSEPKATLNKQKGPNFKNFKPLKRNFLRNATLNKQKGPNFKNFKPLKRSFLRNATLNKQKGPNFKNFKPLKRSFLCNATLNEERGPNFINFNPMKRSILRDAKLNKQNGPNFKNLETQKLNILRAATPNKRRGSNFKIFKPLKRILATLTKQMERSNLCTAKFKKHKGTSGPNFKFFNQQKQSILRKAKLNKQKRTSRPRSGGFFRLRLSFLRTVDIKMHKDTSSPNLKIFKPKRNILPKAPLKKQRGTSRPKCGLRTLERSNLHTAKFQKHKGTPGLNFKILKRLKRSIFRKATLNKQKRTSRPKFGRFRRLKRSYLRIANLKMHKGTSGPNYKFYGTLKRSISRKASRSLNKRKRTYRLNFKFYETLKRSILRKATLNKLKGTSKPKFGGFNGLDRSIFGTAKLQKHKGKSGPNFKIVKPLKQSISRKASLNKQKRTQYFTLKISISRKATINKQKRTSKPKFGGFNGLERSNLRYFKNFKPLTANVSYAYATLLGISRKATLNKQKRASKPKFGGFNGLERSILRYFKNFKPLTANVSYAYAKLRLHLTTLTSRKWITNVSDKLQARQALQGVSQGGAPLHGPGQHCRVQVLERAPPGGSEGDGRLRSPRRHRQGQGSHGRDLPQQRLVDSHKHHPHCTNHQTSSKFILNSITSSFSFKKSHKT